MNKLLLAASAFLLGLSSCTKDSTSPTQSPEGKDFNISFNVALPGGGDIVYPKSRAEGDPIHDESEYKIEKIDLYEFFVPEGATSETTTLFEKHSFTKANGLTSISAGVYTLTLKIPYKYYNEKRKFVFVANDGLDGSSFTSIANGETGTKYSDFLKTLASIKVTDKQDASVLAPAEGIAMSGIAKVGESEDIVLKTAFNCDVKLQRIVARIDVVNNTPNMVITGIKLNNAAAQAYIMPQTPFTTPAGTDIEMQYNSKVENSGGTGLGTDFATQNNSMAGLKKAFYLYERTNAEGNHASVEVTYKLNGTKEDKVVVPFKTTKDQKKWVNIERNHLYKIVLGNGKDVITTPVEITLLDEDWNVIDVDHSVDVEQSKMNAALMVNMFTPYNVATADLAAKTATFETSLKLSTDASSFFSFDDLFTNDLAGIGAPAVFTVDGKKYRLPNRGEMELLLPFYPNVVAFNSQAITSKEFTEILYLENNFDGTPNTEGKSITGVSMLKKAESAKPDGTYIVYGNRLRGSAEHAAYRWELTLQGDTKYLSVKIKALKQFDAITKMDDIAKESYWNGDFIEYKFPLTGCIETGSLIADSNERVRLWSSTRVERRRNDNKPTGYYIYCDLISAEVIFGIQTSYKMPLRLVKANEGDETAYNKWKERKTEIKQSLTNVAVGDFILKDGMVVKPTHFDTHPQDKVKAVAIVASINKDRLSEGAKNAVKASPFGDTPHGLALALKDATPNGQVPWKKTPTISLPEDQFPLISTGNNSAAAYSGSKGYEATHYIITNQMLADHPAFKAVVDYQPYAPENSTGWYVPSTGEWCDIIEGLGNIVLSNDYKTGSKIYYTPMTTQDGTALKAPEILEKINAYLAKVGDENVNYQSFKIMWYWSANEYNATNSCGMLFNSDNGTLYISSGQEKTTNIPTYRVRGVFAF